MAYALAPQYSHHGPSIFNDYIKVEPRSNPLPITDLLSPPRSSFSTSPPASSTTPSVTPAWDSISSAHIRSLVHPTSPSPPPPSRGYRTLPPMASQPPSSYPPITTSPYPPPPEIMQGVSPTSEERFPAAQQPPAPMTAQSAGDPESPPDDSVDGINDGRKAKRELSQSKRAAQNRAAQRAFRQRKEHYIKKLEQQVRDYTEMEQNYKNIQNDNYALREYVIQLQSRLLDVQVEPPQPPPNVNISPPNAPAATAARPSIPSLPPPAQNAAVLDPAMTGPNRGTLADVAAAVAGLSAREPITSPSAESAYPKPPSFKSDIPQDNRNGDEARPQMQDGLPAAPLRT